MTREEKIEYLAKTVMTLSELGDGKTAYALNEIRLEMKSQLELPEGLDEAAEKAGIKRFPMEPGEALDIEGNVYETNDKEWRPARFGFIQGFKAGAEWRDAQISKLPDDTLQEKCSENKNFWFHA